jgi:hypothetical protein
MTLVNFLELLSSLYEPEVENLLLINSYLDEDKKYGIYQEYRLLNKLHLRIVRYYDQDPIHKKTELKVVLKFPKYIMMI